MAHTLYLSDQGRLWLVAKLLVVVGYFGSVVLYSFLADRSGYRTVASLGTLSQHDKTDTTT